MRVNDVSFVQYPEAIGMERILYSSIIYCNLLQMFGAYSVVVDVDFLSYGK